MHKSIITLNLILISLVGLGQTKDTLKNKKENNNFSTIEYATKIENSAFRVTHCAVYMSLCLNSLDTLYVPSNFKVIMIDSIPYNIVRTVTLEKAKTETLLTLPRGLQLGRYYEPMITPSGN